MKKSNKLMPQSRAELKCSEATKISRSFSFKSTFCFLVLRHFFIFKFLFSEFIVKFVYLKFINIVYIFLLLFILLLSGDIETNPGPNYKSNKCRVLYHNIRGLYNNIKDLQIACHKYDIILCSETLVSNRRHISEILLPGFNNPTLIRRY